MRKEYELDQSKKTPDSAVPRTRFKIKENKDVYVVASDWNETLRLLAVVLIDHEIKIYFIK